MKLPPLPAFVYSALGRVSVTFLTSKQARKREVCGSYDYASRAIKINPDMERTCEWVTLWHEITHLALMDAGAHGNTLTKEQEEVVCDALGTHLTAMMLNGSLRLHNPSGRD